MRGRETIPFFAVLRKEVSPTAAGGGFLSAFPAGAYNAMVQILAIDKN